MTFEEKKLRLEQIIKKLESNVQSLDENVSLYKEGKQLLEELNKELNETLTSLSFVVKDGRVIPFSEIDSKKDI